MCRENQKIFHNVKQNNEVFKTDLHNDTLFLSVGKSAMNY